MCNLKVGEVVATAEVLHLVYKKMILGQCLSPFGVPCAVALSLSLPHFVIICRYTLCVGRYSLKHAERVEYK